MVSCNVLFWGRQIQTHSTVPFVTRTASVSVAFSRLDSVELIWLGGGDENEVISIEEEEDEEADNDDRSGSDECDDQEEDV